MLERLVEGRNIHRNIVRQKETEVQDLHARTKRVCFSSFSAHNWPQQIMASTEKDSSPSLKSTGPKAIPADSPLLRPSTPQSPGSRRARELQRDARKARNFRSSLERSGSRSRGKT